MSTMREMLFITFFRNLVDFQNSALNRAEKSSSQVRYFRVPFQKFKNVAFTVLRNCEAKTGEEEGG